MKVLQDEIELLKEYITALDQCIDDYLFILDLDRNEYIISPHAQNRFNILNITDGQAHPIRRNKSS